MPGLRSFKTEESFHAKLAIVDSNSTDSAAAGFLWNLESAITNPAQRGAFAFRFVEDAAGRLVIGPTPTGFYIQDCLPLRLTDANAAGCLMGVRF